MRYITLVRDGLNTQLGIFKNEDRAKLVARFAESFYDYTAEIRAVDEILGVGEFSGEEDFLICILNRIIEDEDDTTYLFEDIDKDELAYGDEVLEKIIKSIDEQNEKIKNEER